MPKPVVAPVLAMVCLLTWLIGLSVPTALAQQDGALQDAPQAAEAAHDPAEPEAAHAAEGDAGDHGSGGHAEGYDSGQWWNFLWRVMNFVVYAGILWYLLRKPLGSFFGGRRESIARRIETLEAEAKEAEERVKQARLKLDSLDTERLEILKRYEADGAAERDRILSEAAKAADLIVKRAETAMEQELKGARRALTVEAGELAMSLARELLTETVTVEDRVRLAHEFVEQVVKLPAKN